MHVDAMGNITINLRKVACQLLQMAALLCLLQSSHLACDRMPPDGILVLRQAGILDENLYREAPMFLPVLEMDSYLAWSELVDAIQMPVLLLAASDDHGEHESPLTFVSEIARISYNMGQYDAPDFPTMYRFRSLVFGEEIRTRVVLEYTIENISANDIVVLANGIAIQVDVKGQGVACTVTHIGHDQVDGIYSLYDLVHISLADEYSDRTEDPIVDSSPFLPIRQPERRMVEQIVRKQQLESIRLEPAETVRLGVAARVDRYLGSEPLTVTFLIENTQNLERNAYVFQHEKYIYTRARRLGYTKRGMAFDIDYAQDSQ